MRNTNPKTHQEKYGDTKMFKHPRVFMSQQIEHALKLTEWANRVKAEIKIKGKSWGFLADSCNMVIRVHDPVSVNTYRDQKKYSFMKPANDGEYKKKNLLKEFLDSESLWTPSAGQKTCMTIHLKCWLYAQGRKYGQDGLGWEMQGHPDTQYLFPMTGLRRQFISNGWIQIEMIDDVRKQFLILPEGLKLQKVRPLLEKKSVPISDYHAGDNYEEVII
jgi:hypothetical protein